MDDTFYKIPLELIKHCIVPYCPLSWLFVSKKWKEVAVHNIVNEPYIISRASVIMKETILARNYPLASVLLTDSRYTQPYSLDSATVAAYDDKIANLILAKHSEGEHMTRILQRAVKFNWIDLIRYIISNNKLKEIKANVNFYKVISQEALELFIEDPKLQRVDEYVIREALGNDNPKIAQMCFRAKNIDLPEIVLHHSYRQNLLSEILKLPALYESNNVVSLWEALSRCLDHRVDFVKETMTKYNLDPSADSNYGLRKIIYNSSSHSSRSIVKLLLDDERVHISLQPYDVNPLFIAIVETRRDVIPTLLEHPKIKPEWIDDILKHLLETEESAYGLEVISRKLSHLVSNKELLDLIPTTIEKIKENVDEYAYFYEPDFWSEEDDVNIHEDG